MRFRGFHRIILGFLFILINFKINGFDLIPDFVGYILILSGLSALAEHHGAFSKARIFAGVLLICSFVGMVESMANPNNTAGSVSMPVWLIGLVPIVCGIGLRLLLGKGMVVLLELYGQDDAARTTTNCISLNIIVLVVSAALTCPPLIGLALVPEVFVPFAVFGVCATVWMLVRIYRNGDLLEERAAAADAAWVQEIRETPSPLTDGDGNHPGGGEEQE